MAFPQRMYARYPCRIAAVLRCPSRRAGLSAEVRDIGMGGALVRLRADIRDPDVELDLPTGEEILTLRASVVRRAGPAPDDPFARQYALVFDPHFSERHKLLRLVDRVRRKLGPKS